MKRGIHKKTKRGKSRQLSFCKRKALTYPKIEELLSTIPPEKYIEKPKTLRILYNSQDPIIIKKRWIRKYKRELKEHHNYTNHNYFKNNHQHLHQKNHQDWEI
jgi:hypothetical protein